MSYSSRVYRQRNPHANEEAPKEGFFSKKHDINPAKKKSGFFQPKLSVNKPGDSFEKEADAVADNVVNKKAGAQGVQKKEISSIQRLSTSMEDEKMATNDARMAKDKEIQEKPMPGGGGKKKKKAVQRKEDMMKEDEKMKGIQKKDEKMKEEDEMKAGNPVQKKQEAGASQAGSQLSSRIEDTSGKGAALPEHTLHEMGSSFGYDFSNVRIHSDSEAGQMNRELQAQAFTHGKDIYFNSGKYDTQSDPGKLLLAHELTHVVQQSGKDENVVQPYRPGKAFNYGRKDTPDLKEESFNLKKDKKKKLWIESIHIVFNGVTTDDDGDMMPTGWLVATYKENDATAALPGLPRMIVFPVTGGKHTELYTHAGKHKVTRIEGVGYSNTSDESEGPMEGPRKRYAVDLNSNMSFAIFFHKGEAVHRGALEIGSHGCVHVDWGGTADEGDTEQLRRLNYHSVIGLTQVVVSYDPVILPELCCKRYEHKKFKKGRGSNPCNKVKAETCP